MYSLADWQLNTFRILKLLGAGGVGVGGRGVGLSRGTCLVRPSTNKSSLTEGCQGFISVEMVMQGPQERLETVQKQHQGNLSETDWSASGLSCKCRCHPELNWTEALLKDGWSLKRGSSTIYTAPPPPPPPPPKWTNAHYSEGKASRIIKSAALKWTTVHFSRCQTIQDHKELCMWPKRFTVLNTSKANRCSRHTVDSPLSISSKKSMTAPNLR